MAKSTPPSEAFKQNAEAALRDGKFEDVLKALIVKLSELGVFSAETAEEARRVNHPLSAAYLRPRSQEARDWAWDNLAARILELGSLLPPEAADGAFLADRAQVEVLLEKDRDIQVAKITKGVNREGVNEESEVGGGRGRGGQDSTEDTPAPYILQGDIFEGLGESQDFFRSVYNPQSVPLRPSASDLKTDHVPPKATGGTETPRTEEDTAVGDWNHYRAIEKQFFKDAIFGSPFLGDVDVHDVIDTPVLSKLVWAIENNPVNDVLWALTLTLAALDVPDAPTEKDTAQLMVSLTLAYDYATEHKDASIRRQAVDTLRLGLLRRVSLLPRDVWASDFLDNRQEVLRLIGDWAQERPNDADTA